MSYSVMWKECYILCNYTPKPRNGKILSLKSETTLQLSAVSYKNFFHIIIEFGYMPKIRSTRQCSLWCLINGEDAY